MTAPAVAGPRETPVANALFEFLLRLGDDRLVLGHRDSEWCGHGPILEEDIATANIALDLVGQASALLRLAGEVEGKDRDEDALAYFREAVEFRNALLVELPRGDFGFTIMRQFLFDAYSVLVWDALQHAKHEGLAGIAAKALKEDKYHLRHSSEWVLRLGDGTEESHARVQRSLDELWRFTGELFEQDGVDAAVVSSGIVLDMGAVRSRWMEMVSDVLQRATLVVPEGVPMATGGRKGRHTEHLGHMLAEMQIVARSYPGAKW
ncbi:MAG TPA: 1,2-phenylacetyl-CoA epoxidase subunit PaaC [Gemmatimonadaceae bacterium]|nr:1,2-phenylacetyl-CoA epoxidase subunit PaaC [Gemmatimonadaceae bacterium]